MLTILLHSSKTMHHSSDARHLYQRPYFIDTSQKLIAYLRGLSISQLETTMKISPAVAQRTYQQIHKWTTQPRNQTPAIDSFAGDIYSGLQSRDFNDIEREYANNHLYILSGLYGILKAGDSIMPYRLEMGYRLPDAPYQNLYAFWGDKIAAFLPAEGLIINLAAAEYTKAVLRYLPSDRIISPKFLTLDTQTNEPKFVTIHAKIARGAFAHWLIKHRCETIDEIVNFNELGYKFNASLSKQGQPVFICKKFAGLGLSVRS